MAKSKKRVRNSVDDLEQARRDLNNCMRWVAVHTKKLAEWRDRHQLALDHFIEISKK